MSSKSRRKKCSVLPQSTRRADVFDERCVPGSLPATIPILMVSSSELLIFTLDARRYALPLESVVRMVRAAEITPLPNAPPVVLGVLDIEGTIFPVLSLRRRLELPDREVAVTDHFLVADTARRTVILVIDAPQGVEKVSQDQITRGAEVAPGLGAHLHGVAALEDGLVLIHDLEAFLSLDEEAALETALAEEGMHGN